MTLLATFKDRRDEEELMDQPSTSRIEFTRALYDIQWANRNLGGTRTLLDEVVALIRRSPRAGSEPVEILDLGTGSADIPLALADWGRENNVPMRITAVDLHPVAVDVSRENAKAFPEIEVVRADALNMEMPHESFDIVTSSMFMHHLKTEEAVRLMQEMARMSRVGFVINDLERHPLAYWSIHVLGHLTGRGKVFRNDAPLSVLRGFTKKDLIELRKLSGLQQLEIRHHKPYRWTLVWKR